MKYKKNLRKLTKIEIGRVYPIYAQSKQAGTGDTLVSDFKDVCLIIH